MLRARIVVPQLAAALALVAVAGPPALAQDPPCGYQVEAVIHGPGCGPIFPAATMVPQQIHDGVAVGWFRVCGIGANEAFVWSPSGGLGTLPRPGGSAGAGAGAREGDIVVGWDFEGIQPQAMLWDDGQMLGLGTGAGGNWSQASAISNGVVVGTWGNNLVANLLEGFRWQQGQFEDLSSLIGGSSSRARDVNVSGSIVGLRYSDPSADAIAFLLAGDELTMLGPLPGGFESDALAINSAQEIVGLGQRIDDMTGEVVIRGFVYRNSVMTELSTLPGFACSAALDISDDGMIVGQVWNPGRAAVIWINDRIVALEDLVVDIGGLELDAAVSIDEDGRILIDGNESNDVIAAVLAPIEAPPADLTCDGQVGPDDFQALLNSWGPCPAVGPCPGDLDGDGSVGIVDFLELLASWT